MQLFLDECNFIKTEKYRWLLVKSNVRSTYFLVPFPFSVTTGNGNESFLPSIACSLYITYDQ